MSVFIKGMEMPDKCGHCRFATAFECEVTKNFITTFNVRQQDCPLVTIPPHGDLIDRDALINHHTIDKYNCSEVISVDDIRSAPTVIQCE